MVSDERFGCGWCAAGYRNKMVRKAVGMPTAMFRRPAKPLSGRYLSLTERKELAILRAQGAGVREIVRQMRQSSSMVSRELRRNAATRSGGLDYRSITAQWHAERTKRRPKPTRLVMNAALRTYAQDRVSGLVVTPGGAAVLVRQCPGMASGTDVSRIGGGLGRRAQSRLPIAYGSSPRTMGRCASATRPSISRFTYKAVALYAVS